MQIKKRLQLNVVVSMVMALVICLVLFLSLYRLNKANNLAKISGEIVSSVLERVTLRNDYIRNNIARAKEQWLAKHEQIGGLLKSASENFKSGEDRINIAELIEDHESIGKIFSAIVANREKRTLRPGPADLSREVEDRLLSQLNMRVYEVVLHSRKLQQSSGEARDSALRLAALGIISVLLILIVAALVNSRTMGRAITNRVRRLHEGAAVIGAGNLDFRIDIKGDDELTELSAAFNAMTAKLSGSYHALQNEIDVRKRAEEALQESEERLRLLGDNLPESAVYQSVHEPDGSVRFLYFSAGIARLNGVSVQDVLQDAGALHRQIPPGYFERLAEAETRSSRELSDLDMDVPMRRPDGQVRWMRLHSRPRRQADGSTIWDGVQMDVTGRKQAEQEKETTVEFLQMVNRTTVSAELVAEAAAFLKRKSGCEAVGIRLKEGNDYPYFEVHGFPEEFVKMENMLCDYDGAGEAVLDEFGNPVLSCMCGNVIRGRFDPSKPFFTANGSFWSNCTTELLASTTDADRQTRTRNRCNGEGYESVALIPLRSGSEPLGLLQLNDKRRGMFTPEIIALWERLAGYLAVALAKLRAEEALLKAHDELEIRVQERTQKLMEAEAATRLANAYNRSLIEVSLDPLVTINAAGKIMDVNTATEKATGLTRAALIGTDFSDYFTEPEKARAGYEMVFREGSVRDYPLELRQGDGRVTPVLYNASVYRDEQGNIVGVFAAARDITTQKQSEEALKNINETLELRVFERTAELRAANESLQASRIAALNLMEDAVLAKKQAENSSTQLQGEVVERKRAEDMLVVLNKDLENRVFQRTRSYSVLAAVNASIVRQHDQQTLFNEVCRIIVETGRFKLVWVGLLDPETREVSPVSSYGATGYLEGIRIIASENLPEGRGPTGMAILEGRHITIMDFENEERMRPWRERAHAHGIRSSSAFPLRSGTQVIGALTIYSDQSGFFTVDEVALLLSLSENLSFAIAAVEAEKERRAAVEAVRKLNEDLEQRVARRTAELEFSNKELEAFIYSVSHDLRAPLRHISGFTKIIAEDYAEKLDEQGKDHLVRIHNGAEKMSHLIEDLLRLSRISRQEMEREQVDLSAMASSVVSEVREADPDGSREVIIQEQLLATADRRLVKLVLQNLIDNAWKFTSKTQNARIEFDAFEQSGKTTYRFKDNGVGFDSAYAGKMFLPFHRLHTETEFQGTGIGLAIVDRVIQRHGGRIWAEGEVGKGATIYFTLN